MKSQTLLFTTTFIVVTMLTLGFSGCKKDEFASSCVLNKLFSTYQNGYIDECQLNGKTVYCAGKNAADAGSFIYNENGDKIGACNYGWGKIDTLCFQITNCETVYRVKDNIWGQAEVNKYGLGK
jgi:hypothetical protein